MLSSNQEKRSIFHQTKQKRIKEEKKKKKKKRKLTVFTFTAKLKASTTPRSLGRGSFQPEHCCHLRGSTAFIQVSPERHRVMLCEAKGAGLFYQGHCNSLTVISLAQDNLTRLIFNSKYPGTHIPA